ncbi:MAG: dihydropteroate synthase [Gammaproteobacteria bacterium]
MGILNLTPDSFSDAGCFIEPPLAVERALAMVSEGADIIDIGGESTRPGAGAVSAAEEQDRVMPVIEALVPELPVPVSIDTSKAEVMAAAVAAGVGFINDVRALREPGALDVAARSGASVCLMHMQGEPRTMQAAPEYADVVGEVFSFLMERVRVCERAGIGGERLVLDPGFGFGKTLAHNLALLRHLERFGEGGMAVLAGISRKSMIGAILADEDGPRPVEGRVHGSVAAALVAAQRGAGIIRVHDVAATADALKMHQALGGAPSAAPMA